MSRESIYERLRKAGCTPTGALALMGNWECESNCEACRVQGDFQSDRLKSKDYASRIDNGRVSDEEWCRDGKGWGLAQWTFWSRKQALLQFCRRRSISVANEEAQVDFAISELQTGYRSVWADLTTCGEEDLYKAVELVCAKYEQPAYNNVQERANAAVTIRNELQGKAVETIDNSVATDTDDKFWPPRTICEGMNGADVEVLQALLRAHGYTLSGSAGVFGVSTDKAVRKFQQDRGLAVDGIAGPMTWAAITKI